MGSIVQPVRNADPSFRVGRGIARAPRPRWRDLLSKAVPEANRALEAAGLASLKSE
jgi:hypothetical protein